MHGLNPPIMDLIKWIKDLSIRSKTTKIPKENIASKLLDIGLGNDFLNLMQKAKATKAKVNKCKYTTLKITKKETINK